MKTETSPTALAQEGTTTGKSSDGRSLPAHLGRRLVLGACFGMIVVAGCLALGDVRKILERLGSFDGWCVVWAAGLALCNYLVRFVRWELYLRRVGVRVPRRDSVLIYGAGFAMAVSPGKVGEILKSYLLREAHGHPMARTTPVVVVERLTDLLALLLLGLVGLRAFHTGGRLVIAGILIVGGGIACVSSRRLSLALLRIVGRLPLLSRFTHRIEEFYDTTASLLAPAPLAYGTALGAIAWMGECLGFYLIARGFHGAAVSLSLAIFIYAITTIAGALSFLPGGLGVTEGSMASLLAASAHGLDRAGATAATLLTRLCTLWLAVGIGLGCLVAIRRILPRRSSMPHPGQAHLPARHGAPDGV